MCSAGTSASLFEVEVQLLIGGAAVQVVVDVVGVAGSCGDES